MNRAFVYYTFALLVTALVTLHTLRFEGRSYRQDEAIIVYTALESTLSQNVMLRSVDNHPPGWVMFSDVWIGLFGHHEQVTRFFGTLITALALAFTYRLGADVFDPLTGIIAVFMLGTSPMVEFHAHEFRSYGLLMAGIIALQGLALRWSKRRNRFPLALFTTGAGVVLVYTHFFGTFAVISVFVALFLLARGRWRWRALVLCVLIGTSFTPWILPFIHLSLVQLPGGFTWYPPFDLPVTLLLHLQLMGLVGVGPVLILTGILLPVQVRLPEFPHLRFGRRAGQIYLLAFPVLLLSIALTTNQFAASLTARNLIGLLPTLAILAAFAVRIMPMPLKWVIIWALLFIFVPFNIPFPRYLYINDPAESGTYREMMAAIAPRFSADTLVIVDSQYVTKHNTLLYYLHWRLPYPLQSDHLVHLIDFSGRQYERLIAGAIPQWDGAIVFLESASWYDMQRFRRWLGDAPRVWYVTDRATPQRSAYVFALEQDYALIYAASFGDENAVALYQRAP